MAANLHFYQEMLIFTRFSPAISRFSEIFRHLFFYYHSIFLSKLILLLRFSGNIVVFQCFASGVILDLLYENTFFKVKRPFDPNRIPWYNTLRKHVPSPSGIAKYRKGISPG